MLVFFFQAEDGIRDGTVTGVQTCALPISPSGGRRSALGRSRAQTFGLRMAADPEVHVRDGRLETLVVGIDRPRSEERRVGKSVDRGGGSIRQRQKYWCSRRTGCMV